MEYGHLPQMGLSTLQSEHEASGMAEGEAFGLFQDGAEKVGSEMVAQGGAGEGASGMEVAGVAL